MVFPGYELPYAVAISVLSIASHSYFQPYKAGPCQIFTFKDVQHI